MAQNKAESLSDVAFVRELGEGAAIEALQARRAANMEREQVDNSALYAGSPMYHYCKPCGDLVATLPESHRELPPALCEECKVLEKLGWLDDLRPEFPIRKSVRLPPRVNKIEADGMPTDPDAWCRANFGR